jgi:Na+/H+-dicarboxylate symporter
MLYGLSLSVKSVIIFILPFMIFMILFKTIAQLSKGATKLVVMILLGVCCSNFLSTMISYQIGKGVYQLDLAIAHPQQEEGLMPAWILQLPNLIANDHAMFLGIILGIVLSLTVPGLAKKFSSICDKGVAAIMKLLVVIVPFFISGFMIKLSHDQVMNHIVRDYALIFCLVALSLVCYLLMIYLASSRFKFREFLDKVQNILPAAVTGFSTMSSAAAMPLSIVGSEKNVEDPSIARLVVPATVNVHLVGDCLAIPIFAFAVMKNYAIPFPEFSVYLIFAMYFVIAKFSVAAIPGGGIIVMLPILESQLGFTGEMSSLITSLYILFDPVITCANVCGNGGFVMVIDRLKALITKRRLQKFENTF